MRNGSRSETSNPTSPDDESGSFRPTEGIMSDSKYEVIRHEHGRVIVGPVPVSEFCALAKVWTEEGLTLIDSLIAQHLRASMVATSPEGSRAWREELGVVVPKEVAPE